VKIIRVLRKVYRVNPVFYEEKDCISSGGEGHGRFRPDRRMICSHERMPPDYLVIARPTNSENSIREWFKEKRLVVESFSVKNSR
jgi:hypothetical protein